MKPAKIRLLEPQFRSYTGILCGAMFEDGVSISKLPFLDQQRICASMRAETFEGKNVSVTGMYSELHDVSADDAKKTEVSAPKINSLKREETVVTQSFSREELEALADAEGISGLRAVGNKMGVKAKGIEEMIEGILKAQLQGGA